MDEWITKQFYLYFNQVVVSKIEQSQATVNTKNKSKNQGRNLKNI